MTSPEGCDGCHDEVDLFAVSNRDTGQAQFLGPLCLALFGATMLIGASTDVADAAFKELGYQPTAATKKARKDAEVPEYDAKRPILDVVEDRPRPPGDESTEIQDDQSADQFVDTVPEVEVEGDDECPVCGAMVLDSRQEAHFRSEHADLAPY